MEKSYDPSIACRYDYYSLSFSTVEAATTAAAASLHCSLQQVRLPLPARQLDLASSVPCHPLSLGVTARKHSRSCNTKSHNPPVLREAWTPLLLQRSPRFLLLFLPYPATRSPTRVHARTFARDVTTFCDTSEQSAERPASCRADADIGWVVVVVGWVSPLR